MVQQVQQVQHVAQRSRPHGRLRWCGRGLTAVFLIAALTAVPRGSVRAQSGGEAPEIGTAVPFVGTEGGTLAEITIDEVEDPFQDYDPSAAPLRAHHFVLLTLSVENTGNRPLSFDPNAIAIQDDEGFLARPLYLPRSEESMAALPDYPVGDIPPGDTSSGALAFQVLNDTGLLNVVYLPAYDRLVVLAGLASEAGSAPSDADAGETDTATDSDADAAATPAASAGDDRAGDSEDDAAASAEIDCDLATAWAIGTDERLDAVGLLVAELEDFDRETADPVRLAEISAEFQEMADGQADESAPPQLQDASDMLADAFQTFADLFDQASTAAANGELDAAADDINADGADANDVMVAAGKLAQPELAACGLS